MKKIFLLFFISIISISFSFSHENSFSCDINANEKKISLTHSPELVEIAGGYVRLAKMGEGHFTALGQPELPTYTTYYQLDPSKTYDFELEILETQVMEDIIILPHQGMEKWEVNAVEVIDENIYDSYHPFPSKNMIVSERSQGRGIEFLSIQVIPYTYHPKYNRLEIFTSIEINVIETGDNPNNELNQPNRSHMFDAFYEDLIVNFQPSDRPEDYQASAILYIGGGNSMNNSYVQDLIQWRHKQGYIVYTATESQVGGSSTSQIKNYIQDAYFNWENPPEIVGLIGDVSGSYGLSNYNHQWGGYNGPTDFDYTQLDGGDLLPEIFIGRISGSSSDLDNIINKTILYEKATYIDGRSFKNAALAADPDESGNSTIFTSQYIENIMINHGMNGVEYDFDGSNVDGFMEDQFDRGILYYNYRGWYYGDGSWPTGGIPVSYDTPFVTTLTCGTGDFDGTSSSEEFVRLGSVNNPKGAVASVGMATTGTHTAYNNIVNMGIYEGIFSKDLWYAGAVVAMGDMAIVKTYPNPNDAEDAAEAFSKWSNLMGDPALHLWTGTPANFNFSHPSSITLGNTMLELIITNEDGNVVEGARVTLLMGDDDIFTTGLTDENGQITLTWDAVMSGNMDITVIKRNHRPYEGSIEISDAVGAAVSMSSSEIYVNSGEETDMAISLHNYGTSMANDVFVELSSNSEYVSILDPMMTVGDLAMSEDAMVNFSIYVHGTAYHMEELSLFLTITDSNDNVWINYVPIHVMGPSLFISGYDGNVEPGASTILGLEMENNGSRDMVDYSFELLSHGNQVFVHSPSIMINELLSGQQIDLNDFELTFDEDIINGSVIPMELLITSSDGHSRMHVINVTVGDVRETDPLGPDAHGYYIYDSGDVDYELAPEYDWVEIADGVGEQLNISDSGNGNSCYTCNTLERVLPFSFNFYGIEYDKVQINTNGWISFGEHSMSAFRNYPIPGAGGPSPMVAAFWDDLKTGSSGYVYYHASDDQVVIQWDDMRTCGDLSGGWYASNCSVGPRQTFEIILYDTNEIKIQYQDFNNASNGDYSGGTPSHGCYSTVGIENHLGDVGLEYTFNNVYPDAASTLQDGSALFISNVENSDFIIGDINGDEVLDILDVVVLINAVLDDGFYEEADMNQDGVLDILDIVLLVNIILE